MVPKLMRVLDSSGIKGAYLERCREVWLFEYDRAAKNFWRRLAPQNQHSGLALDGRCCVVSLISRCPPTPARFFNRGKYEHRFLIESLTFHGLGFTKKWEHDQLHRLIA
jgi:hypothetical protein